MKRKILRWAQLLCLGVLLIFYNSCQTATQFIKTNGGSTVGNPYSPGLASMKILESVCTKLVSCHPNLDAGTCMTGVLAVNGMGSALGLPSFDSLQEIVSAEAGGTLAPRETSVSTCGTQTENLSCDLPEVRAAYDATASSPFGQVPTMLPRGANSCTSSYQVVWQFVDKKAEGGINISTAAGAWNPQSIVFNNKLYAVWNENGLVRTAVYNGNDVAPVWTATDGGGLNFDKAQVTFGQTYGVWNNQLFAAWIESDSGGVGQLRVSVYNGDDAAPAWSRVDGNGPEGINFNTSGKAIYTPSLVSFNSKLYISWSETDGTNQVHVSVFDGVSSWKSVSGGSSSLNLSSSSQAIEPTLYVFNSKLYASWAETTASMYQTRVAVYNSNDSSPQWRFVDGGNSLGINVATSSSSEHPKLMAMNSKLYAAWDEFGPIYKMHFKVYNGDDNAPAWTQVDSQSTGSNFDITKSAQFVDLADLNGKLYASWQEGDPSGVLQIRVAVYGGNDLAPAWNFIDGNGAEGINFDITKQAEVPHLTVFNSRIYNIWQELGNPANQARIAVGP